MTGLSTEDVVTTSEIVVDDDTFAAAAAASVVTLLTIAVVGSVDEISGLVAVEDVIFTFADRVVVVTVVDDGFGVVDVVVDVAKVEEIVDLAVVVEVDVVVVVVVDWVVDEVVDGATLGNKTHSGVVSGCNSCVALNIK